MMIKPGALKILTRADRGRGTQPQAGSVEGFQQAWHEIDRLVMVHVFGIPEREIFKSHPDSVAYQWIPSGKPRRTHMVDAEYLPIFSRDLNDVFGMRRMLEADGKHEDYIKELWSLIIPNVPSTEELSYGDIFLLAQASPYYHCVAALRAVGYQGEQQTETEGA